ncbi:MAG: class I SAM-dependent methyltransferase [Bacteroidales bacterium]
MEYPEDKIRSIYDKASSIPPLFSWYAEEILTRMKIYRNKAVSLLNLTENSIVLDVACGIGFNFRFIEKYLGNNGTIVGVELSTKTVKLAKKRIVKHGWTNIELVNMSIMDYEPEILFDAIICTQAMEIIPEAAVDKIFQLLKPQGRFSMIGMKPSSRIPYRLLNPFMEYLAKSGGIDIHRDVYKYIETKCNKVNYEEYLGGFYYILSTSGRYSATLHSGM